MRDKKVIVNYVFTNNIYYYKNIAIIEKNNKIRRSQLWRFRQKTKLRRREKLLKIADAEKKNAPSTSANMNIVQNLKEQGSNKQKKSLKVRYENNLQMSIKKY